MALVIQNRSEKGIEKSTSRVRCGLLIDETFHEHLECCQAQLGMPRSPMP